MKKVLLLGGTGAMGVYLIPELLNKGYKVDVVSLDDVKSENPNLSYLKMDCKDIGVQKKLLENKYDAVVDFLIYNGDPNTEFKPRMEQFLANTGHYVYFSSYRVYADEEHPIKETSPRLLDVSENADFLAVANNEYSLYKAEGEELLKKSGKKNYTIVRPAITFSKRRFQLTTLEADVLIARMQDGKKVVLPEAAMDKQATMSWAGDVAKMLCAIVLNEKAYGEAYTLATAEHQTWREITKIYAEIGGLKYITVDTDTYLNIVNPGSPYARYQLEYDRCFDRIVDNSKILELAQIKQSELMPIKEALKMEFEALPKDVKWNHSDINDRMDAYLKSIE